MGETLTKESSWVAVAIVQEVEMRAERSGQVQEKLT